MDIQYLCEFVVLAELCNYQEAAEALHVSQSALSKHIQKLEEGLTSRCLSAPHGQSR